MKKISRGGWIRYVVYLALVTSVLTSVTLAKYASTGGTTGKALVASFITGTTLDLDVSLEGMMGPGDTKTVNFDVTNYEGDKNNNVVLQYEIQVNTTGNLPLEFALTGEQRNADGSADADLDVSKLAGSLDDNLKAVGGMLPPAGEFGKKTHSYKLQITWPRDKADEGYSDEIDRVALRISSTQGAS